MLRIQELRLSANLTQKELAQKIGVKNYTIANWEQNRTEPSIKDLLDVADFFECSVDYLLGRENDFGNIIISKTEKQEDLEIVYLYNSLSPERKKIVYAILQDLNKVTKNEE